MESRKIIIGTMLAFAICLQNASGQSDLSCPADEINDHLLQTDPRFARSFMYFEQAVEQQLALDPADRDDEIYTLPVVVHVIHEGEPIGTGSNITDAQILSAIDAINNDFRKVAGTNGDGDGVDTGIQFCMAARDPDGNSTNGIIRVNGSGVPNYADQGIEATGGLGADEAAVKALSTWPREDYINVWIVNEIEDNNAGSGIQGFAYFPVDSPLDGIVILHNAFGTVGNLKSSTNLNRTFTHETGHYLALYHTFHNTTNCNAEANCTTAGDHVCDTPVTPLQTACASPACSGTQQVENYLDYTSETCRNMFTDGQKVRMRTTLLSDRASLLESLGCMPVSELDCGITYINSPSGATCDGYQTPVVYLTNFGSETLTSCVIHYNIDGVGNNTYNWTGSLASAASEEIDLNGLNAAIGNHEFFAWTTAPNGGADENSQNDQLSTSFSVAYGGGATLIVELDYFGTENTWEIFNESDEVIVSGGPYFNNQPGTIIEENLCLATGCYTITFYDDYGDGQGFPGGGFTLVNGQDSVLVSVVDNWGEEASGDFCLEEYVPEGFPPFSIFDLSDNSICKNSTVDFSDLSANAPEGWSWTFEGGTPSTSNQQHPQNIVYANAGSFDVTLTVTNSFGSDSYTCTDCVTVLAGPNATINKNDVLCYGGNNGSATVVPSGGNSPYTYLWNNGQTSVTISSLIAGTYSVTVTDEDGCTKTQSTSVAQPATITVGGTPVNISCHDMDDGEITAIASGGTSPYSYSWSNGQNVATATGLTPGSHTVTVTDSHSCQKEQSYMITEPAVLVSNLMDFDIACSAVSGSAQVSPSGGTSPYSVDWSNGATGNNVSGLGLGNYSATITDAHDCEVSSSFAITQSDNLTVNIVPGEISCAGADDGTAVVLVSGGTGTYTFEWSNGATEDMLENMGPGNYSVTVQDSEGCDGTDSFTLVAPAPAALAVFKTDISCFGMNDGTATATASGGTGTFEYLWSNGSESNSIGDLDEGTYMITATDEHGCTDTELITIIEPSELVATCSLILPETCAGGDGEAVVNVLGGTPGYTYLWTNGAQGMLIQNVSGGWYNVTVTDGNSCEKSAGVEVLYECDLDIPVTTLTDTDCEQVGYSLTDVVHCNEVTDAEMYRWKFTNETSGELLTEEYSLEPVFMLSEVDGLGYGMIALVQVKVMMDGSWGEYGNECHITTESQLPVTGLVAGDCGAEDVMTGTVISADNIAGASSYEWHITGESYDFTTYTTINQLTLNANMQFQSNHTYEIQVRCLVTGDWTEFGPTCSITFGDINAIEDLSSGRSITLYPNPCDGTSIVFDFGNLLGEAEVKDLTIYGVSGNLVETVQLSETNFSGSRIEYRFKHPLSTGMYLVRYTINDKSSEEKLIVR